MMLSQEFWICYEIIKKSTYSVEMILKRFPNIWNNSRISTHKKSVWSLIEGAGNKDDDKTIIRILETMSNSETIK